MFSFPSLKMKKMIIIYLIYVLLWCDTLIKSHETKIHTHNRVENRRNGEKKKKITFDNPPIKAYN